MAAVWADIASLGPFGPLVGGVVGTLVGATISRSMILPWFDRRRSPQAASLVQRPGRVARGWTVPLDIPLDAGDSYHAALWVLAAAGARQVTDSDPGTVSGWTAMSWRSWGQQVGVTLGTPAGGAITVYCWSRPRFSCTLSDMGVSRRQAQWLAATLHARLLAPRVW